MAGVASRGLLARLVLLFGAVALAATSASAGTLDDLDRAVSRPPASVDTRAARSSNDEDDDNILSSLISVGRLISLGLRATGALAGSGTSRYSDGVNVAGPLAIEADEEEEEAERGLLRVIRGEENGPVHLVGLEGRARIYRGWGLSGATFDYWQGRESNRDHLLFHRAAICYRTGISRLNLGFEAGWRGMRGGSRDRDGLDVGVTLDIAPWEHWRFDVMARAGGLGGHEVRELRAGVSWTVSKLEIGGGYRYLNVAGVGLGGPEVTVGVRF